MRVVSLLPSATEIVAALGHRSELVGRSEECDYPADVRDLPVVMRPRTLDANRPSIEIDARVREARSRGESLYELDIELLHRLRPDLLLTQDLCGVCSVTEREVSDACSRAGVAPHVVSLTPRRLEEVWASVGQVAEALNDPPAGAVLAQRLRAVSARRTRVGARPRVLMVEWLDPPILAGLWTPDIIARAGGSPLGPAPGETGQRTTWDAVDAARADLVILSPCSFPVERTLAELRAPKLRRELRRLVPPLGVFAADEAYFSRPGPRLAEGVRLVRDLIVGDQREPPMPVVSLRDRFRAVTA